MKCFEKLVQLLIQDSIPARLASHHLLWEQIDAQRTPYPPPSVFTNSKKKKKKTTPMSQCCLWISAHHSIQSPQLGFGNHTPLHVHLQHWQPSGSGANRTICCWKPTNPRNWLLSLKNESKDTHSCLYQWIWAAVGEQFQVPGNYKHREPVTVIIHIHPEK